MHWGYPGLLEVSSTMLEAAPGLLKGINRDPQKLPWGWSKGSTVIHMSCFGQLETSSTTCTACQGPLRHEKSG
jgi:hypothetical protein